MQKCNMNSVPVYRNKINVYECSSWFLKLALTSSFALNIGKPFYDFKEVGVCIIGWSRARGGLTHIILQWMIWIKYISRIALHKYMDFANCINQAVLFRNIYNNWIIQRPFYSFYDKIHLSSIPSYNLLWWDYIQQSIIGNTVKFITSNLYAKPTRNRSGLIKLRGNWCVANVLAPPARNIDQIRGHIETKYFCCYQQNVAALVTQPWAPSSAVARRF